MKLSSQEKILALGVSRGLGRSTMLTRALVNAGPELSLVARKVELLQELQFELATSGLSAHSFSLDLAQEDCLDSLLPLVESFKPTRIWYFAGGGPHGDFGQKKWQAHQWALQLNFLTPAKLLHGLLNQKYEFLKQVLFVGSDVAESKPDPGAASYAAAKHALRGLITSVQFENPPFDLRLASPGYMDTAMLPPQSWPRQKGLASNPDSVASNLVQWLESTDDANRHNAF